MEKARMLLREHILQNKEKVASDLQKLREKSNGNDIYNYINKLSNSFSFNHLEIIEEIEFSLGIIESECYKLDYNQNFNHFTYPSTNTRNCDNNLKKDSELISESFFLYKFAVC